MTLSSFMMAVPRLRKLLSKQNVQSLLQEFAKESCFVVLDDKDAVVFGHLDDSSFQTAPILVNGESIGSVRGVRYTDAIAAVISYVAVQEIQAKSLANEALNKYEEINFLFNLSRRFALCKTVSEVAQIAMHESRQIISTTGGSVLLLNPQQEILEVTAAWGDAEKSKLIVKPGEGIQGQIFLTGEAEIINDVPEDERYQPRMHSIQSMISAPIKSRLNTLGVINLFHSRPFFYTANELRLLVTTAEQAGVILENFMLLEAEQS